MPPRKELVTAVRKNFSLNSLCITPCLNHEHETFILKKGCSYWYFL